jgi:hypothetical protein
MDPPDFTREIVIPLVENSVLKKEESYLASKIGHGNIG